MERSDALPRQVACAAIVALLLSCAVVAGWFDRGFLIPSPETWQKGHLVTDAYDPPTQPVELFHNQGDGQVFAHEAKDPFLARPDGVRGGPSEEAYRLQRPLYGWAGWFASAGDPDLVGWSLIWVTILSVVALTALAAVACARLGASASWGLAVLAAPGVAVNLIRCGPEAAGTALVAAGLVAWWSSRRRVGLAVACFAAAGLCRESMLLVPFALALAEALPATTGRLRAFCRSPLLLSAVPWVVWVLLLRLRVDAWPTGTAEGRLSLVPFGGLVRGARWWGHEEVISFVLIAGPAVAALLSRADRRLRVIVGAQVLFAATFGPTVWFTWLGFARVLLPLSLVSLLALCDAWRGAGRGAATAAADPRMEGCSDPRPAPSPMPLAPTSSRTSTAG